MRRKLLSAALLLVALALALTLARVFMPLEGSPEGAEVTVEQGMSFSQAVNAIAGEGLLTNRHLFTLAARLTGLDKRLRPGLYVFEGRQSTWSVFNTLRKGKVRLLTVTISEGENLSQIGQKLREKGIVNAPDFERLVNDGVLMSSLNINAPSMEGYLFPETYFFTHGIKPERVIEIMVRKAREVTGPLLEKAAEMGMDETELLTMASIIEKEARLDEERPVISAVYHNRLRKGIRLQADPTVVYGIKPLGAGITRKDLKRSTPYNTYVINGLPPGPIASPGRKSIEAAAAPEDVPYLFFVSNNDGSHVFTSTLKEHNQAVKAYRVGRSIMKRKKNGKAGDGDSDPNS